MVRTKSVNIRYFKAPQESYIILGISANGTCYAGIPGEKQFINVFATLEAAKEMLVKYSAEPTRANCVFRIFKIKGLEFEAVVGEAANKGQMVPDTEMTSLLYEGETNLAK